MGECSRKFLGQKVYLKTTLETMNLYFSSHLRLKRNKEDCSSNNTNRLKFKGTGFLSDFAHLFKHK